MTLIGHADIAATGRPPENTLYWVLPMALLRQTENGVIRDQRLLLHVFTFWGGVGLMAGMLADTVARCTGKSGE